MIMCDNGFTQKKIKFKPRIKLNHSIFAATLLNFPDYCSLYIRVETHEGLKCATLMCLLFPMLVNIHFRKGTRRKDIDQSNFVNDVTYITPRSRVR